MLAIIYALIHFLLAVAQSSSCSVNATYLELSDPPYENYLYSDCNSSTQVVVTSPLPDSDLTVIGPRLLVHTQLRLSRWF